MSADADYRKRRYNDLTAAGKHSYDTDSAYRKRRDTQWNQEFAAQGVGTAKAPATTATPTSKPVAANPSSPFAANSSSASVPPDYTSTASLLGLNAAEGLAEVGDYTNPSGYYQSGRDPQGGGDINAGPRGEHLQVYQVLQGYYKLNPTELIALQKQLYDAGYYPDSFYGGNKKPTFGNGDPDDPGYAAYVRAVKDASLHKATVAGTIGARAGSGAAKAADGSGAVKQGEIVTLTSPDDIKTIAEKTIPDLIGRKLNDAELAGLIGVFHAAEKAYYDKQYAASGSGLPGGPGGTVGAAPSLSSFAEQQAQKLHPEEYQRQQELNGIDTVMGAIRRGSGL